MADRDTRASYIALWVFALAFGWIEAAAVVYLRQTSPQATGDAVQFPLMLISADLVSVEIVREACTLLLLGAAAWLSARRWADRIGAFLLMFGVWDLAYYAVLRLVVGWPRALTNWDILFLIPLPWIAPVWAPATVATIFVVAGSYLFWTARKPRHYAARDFAIVLASAGAIVAAFLVEWRVVFATDVPEYFPHWLYWAGVILGTAWFVRAERRGFSHGHAR
jgi:hypothetical protein